MFFPTAIGVLLAMMGFTLRYVSIHILGKYFRTTVEIDEDQPIVKSWVPIALSDTRPIVGSFFSLSDMEFCRRTWLCLALCVLLPIAALSYRIKVEEGAFLRELGDKI